MPRVNISKEDFIEKYNSMSTTEMARVLGLSRQTIVNLARKYQLPYKQSGGHKPKKTIVISKQELERLYNTMTTKELARFLDISTVTLVRIVKDNGIKLKTVGHGVRKRKIVVEG